MVHERFRTYGLPVSGRLASCGHRASGKFKAGSGPEKYGKAAFRRGPILKRYGLRDVQAIRDFEERFELIGIPALLIQVLTGLALAYLHVQPGQWFSFEDHYATTIALKLILLGTTILFALDARLRIIPRLDESRLWSLAWHIIPVTILSVLFVILGATARGGGIRGFSPEYSRTVKVPDQYFERGGRFSGA